MNFCNVINSRTADDTAFFFSNTFERQIRLKCQGKIVNGKSVIHFLYDLYFIQWV